MTNEEFDWCIEQTLFFPTGEPLNMILDDGGDLTAMVHDKFPELLGGIPRPLRRNDHRRPSPLPDARARRAESARDQRQRLGHQEQVRQPLRLPRIAGRRHQAGDRHHDRRQGGRRSPATATSAKGCAQAMRGLGARVIVTEIDPIIALQAAMEGYEVTTMEEAVEEGDIFVTTTGCRDIITGKHMSQMKNDAIVCNIGHFDLEIDMAWLEGEVKAGRVKKQNIKPKHVGAVDKFTFADGHSIVVLAEGRLVNLGCATGHPSFVMSNSFTNQVLAPARAVDRDGQVRDRRPRAAQEARRRSRPAAPGEARREAHEAHAEAGRVHRRARSKGRTSRSFIIRNFLRINLAIY